MTDFEWLYLCLAACYLLECLVQTDAGRTLFYRGLCSMRLSRSPGLSLSAEKRLVLLNPLPWAGQWRLVRRLPVTFAPEGIVGASSVEETAAGPSVLIPYDSDQGGELLRQVFPPDAPQACAFFPSAVEAFLACHTDPAPALAQARALRQSVLPLQILCTVEFMLLFAGMPLALRHYPLELLLLPFLAAIYSLSLLIALTFWRKHRALFPGASRQRWGRACSMLIYPLAAMRAVQFLCRAPASSFHESVFVRAFMSPPAQRAYLSRLFAELEHKTFPLSLEPEASAALARTNASLAAAISRHWNPAEAPPPLHMPEPGSACHCPVCGISLAVLAEYCPHCREVRMQGNDASGGQRA